MVEIDGVAIGEGEMRQLQLGDRSLLLCRVEGQLYATNGYCPHRGAMLGQGQLEGRQVICPWHGWAFDVTTGEGITNPVSCVETFQVREEGDRVVVEI